MSFTIHKATVSDCEMLYELQIKSFRALLDKYQDYETNPGAENIDRTLGRLNEANTDYYFIRLDDKNIGAIRIVCSNDLCELKQIYILPDYQGNGYAQKAISLAEHKYPHTRNWKLDTIKQESKLCHLYEKMGYKQTGREENIKDGMTIVFYGKQN